MWKHSQIALHTDFKVSITNWSRIEWFGGLDKGNSTSSKGGKKNCTTNPSTLVEYYPGGSLFSQDTKVRTDRRVVSDLLKRTRLPFKSHNKNNCERERERIIS